MDNNNIIVLIILTITVIMLVFEILRVDVVALLCLLALGWTGVLGPKELFSGFSSNAVIVMMAVMIMGRGIDKTGIMDRFSIWMLSKIGSNKRNVIGALSITIGFISGFIQNIGAIALFLPGVINVSRRLKLHLSELLMPLGFAAILGGTLTMVGSGPLILVNDLLHSAGLTPYNIFSVTPVGILLLLGGTGYFLLFGKYLLPQKSSELDMRSTQEKMVENLNLPHQLWHYTVPAGSRMVGKTLEDTGVWKIPGVHILGVTRGKEVEYAPWRQSQIELGQELILMGEDTSVHQFAADNDLIPVDAKDHFTELHDPERSGFVEVIIPHGSEIIGKTLREYTLRRRYEVEPVMLFSKGEEIAADFSDHKVMAGDAFIVHGLWERMIDLKTSNDFVVATPFEVEKKLRSKIPAALSCFAAAIVLSLFGFPIALSFLTGAVGMVVLKVLNIQEAYLAIEWKVVFLLAGLIPLGIAMQTTGTATILAEHLIELVIGKHIILLVLMVGVLATVFSLVMTNVGAIVVLAPLVIEMASIAGVDPRPLVLLAAVCVANSFILPTHQVNAFILTPGNYRNYDFIRAGSGLTLLFLIIAVGFFYIIMI